MSKAERTREQLVDVALRLFRERGYDAATMRVIAAEAGVSPGNAYYHFAGKEELVQELYLRIQGEHRERLAPRLTPGAPLAENLAAALHTGLDTMAPYHAFGATLVTSALRPTSSVSPFAPASSAPRDLAVGLFAEVVEQSRGRAPAAVAQQLPRLLWLAYLALTLHWVIDDSPDQRRTRALADDTARLADKAVRLARLPLAAGFVTDLATVVERLGHTERSTT